MHAPVKMAVSPRLKRVNQPRQFELMRVNQSYQKQEEHSEQPGTRPIGRPLT